MTGDQLVGGTGLHYHLFGGIRAEWSGRAVELGGRKQRAVLAVLLADVGHVVSVDRLIDRVWGEAAPARAVVSLQAYISNLRRLLDADRVPGEASSVIVSEPGGYRMAVDRGRVDVARFEDLQRSGLAAVAAGDLAAGAGHLTRATALYGVAAPELSGYDWVRDLRARLDGLHADALEASFDAQLGLGMHREITVDIEAAVATHPFRERLRAQLALALYRSGRQTEALRTLTDARHTLAEAVGVEPGPELARLETDILNHAPRLEVARHGERDVTAPVTTGVPRERSSSPARVRRPTGVDLVGRADELAVLVEAARAAAHGRGGAVVISGDAGIGKTRLAEELVARCPQVPFADTSADHSAPGAASLAGWPEPLLVARARCPESASAAPGSACIQLFEQVVAAGVLDPEAVRHATALAEATTPPSGLVDPGAERYEFHAAAVAAFRSTRRPLLLTVDDLQWADHSSLRLLEFLAGELPTLPVLLVVTVRPLPPDPPAPLVGCLSELARHSSAPRVELRGLDAGEVEQWMRQRAGTVDPGVADLVYGRTSGNPFFVGEVVELLASRDGVADIDAARRLGVPAAVQDVVRQRVERLPSETRKLLDLAAVLGVAVGVDLLGHMADSSVPTVIDALDPALDSGILVADPETPGRLRFTHALVAEVVARDLPLSRRARLHVAAVEAIEDLRSPDLDEHLGDLAHHAAEGALAGTAPAAFVYMARAAGLATSRRAYDDAVVYWERARQLMDTARPGDQRARLDVALELARARARVDDLPAAQAATLEAIRLAQALGEPALATRAAAGLPTMIWSPTRYGETDPELVAALQGILADDSFSRDPAQRADILGAAADLVYYEDEALSDEWSAASLTEARAVGDHEVLARALNRRLTALQRPGRTGDREDLAAEFVTLVDGDPELPADLAGVAYFNRAVLALDRGRRAAFEADLARSRHLAERSRSPGLATHLGWLETGWLQGLGRYPEAEQLAEETYLRHRRTRRWDGDEVIAAHRSCIAHDRGEQDAALADLSPLLDAGLNMDTGLRELLAWMLTENGELDAARSLVGPVGVVPDLARDWTWLAVTGGMSYTRAALGDVDACRTLYPQLRPHEGHLLVAGPGGPILGSADLALARLAQTLGDTTAARRHLDAAVEMFDRLGLRPWSARALVTRYEQLVSSPVPADRQAAAGVLAQCRHLAEELGLVPVLRTLSRIESSSDFQA